VEGAAGKLLDKLKGLANDASAHSTIWTTSAPAQ
jgi:hypothetical protein